MLTCWKESYDQPGQHIKKQRHYFANKGQSSQGYGFSSGHVWMWELDCEESWVPKNWHFSTVVLEKTLESLLDCKEIQPVHLKGDQSWVFIGRTDVEAETPLLWPFDAKSWLIGKDPDAGKDWRQEKKEITEDEMVGWHDWLDGHGFGWTQGFGDGHEDLVCCGSWGCKESDMTERLNWTGYKEKSICISWLKNKNNDVCSLFLAVPHTECGILGLRLGIEPTIAALDMWSLKHWITGQVLIMIFSSSLSCFVCLCHWAYFLITGLSLFLKFVSHRNTYTHIHFCLFNNEKHSISMRLACSCFNKLPHHHHPNLIWLVCLGDKEGLSWHSQIIFGRI